MEKIVLQAASRAITGKQVEQLRRTGTLPAVIYGYGTEPISISLEAHSTGLILSKASASTLIVIEVEGKQYATLVREKQRHPVKGSLRHVDFLAVSLTEKTHAKVGIHFIGVSPAVKEFGANIQQLINELDVEGLPTDLPENFIVDLAALKEIGDHILVSDVLSSDKIEILTDMEAIVALASAPTLVVEAEEEEEVAEGEEPEVIEKSKKDEDEE